MPCPKAETHDAGVPAFSFRRCAAKTTPQGGPGTTVFDHCRHVGAVADVLRRSTLPPRARRLLPENVALPAALHDVGKVSPGYQLRHFASLVREIAPALARLDPSRFETKHASISAAAIDRWLGRRGTPLAAAVGAHHGVLDRGHAPDNAGKNGGESWSRERQRLIAALVGCSGPLTADSRPPQVSPPLLAGLVSVADWLGSDERFFPADAPPAPGDMAATAARALDACGFRAPPLRAGLGFQDVFGFPPHPLQERFIEMVTGPGLYVLEAPMGLGKTEAALFAAYKLMAAGHNRGLYFALPTRLASDRIHERVGRFLRAVSTGKDVPLLAHGLAWLRAFEEGGGRYAPGEKEWFGPLKRALLAPYAVGTIDQALLAVLNVRHNFIRTYGLAGKVVILDEVHSYDVYTGALLDRLTERLLAVGATVIVLSATLTAARREQLAPALVAVKADAYPLAIRAADGAPAAVVPLPPPRTVTCRTRIEPWDDAGVARAAAAAATQGQCVLCIANTVDRAQSWYRAVRSASPAAAFETGLLHARFPLFRREELEARWVGALGRDGERPHGCVLVATQIAEQSIDIDADFLISELAPADMLLQRLGRLWRHTRATRPCDMPRIVVVAAGDPAAAGDREEAAEILGRGNCRVYAPYVLARTHEVWRRLHHVRLPGDIRPIIEATYKEAGEGERALMAGLREDMRRRAQRLAACAESAADDTFGMPVGSDDEESAPTRYSDLPHTNVLLVRAMDAPDPSCARITLLNGEKVVADAKCRDGRVTWQLHCNLAPVASHLLPAEFPPAPWLKKHFFRPPPVLTWSSGDVVLRAGDADTLLGYRPDLGLFRLDRGSDAAIPDLSPADGGSRAAAPLDLARNDW